MKKIFITGGAGYVGAVLVPYLLNKDYTVTVLDLMIYGEDVLPSHPNINAIKGDIRDQKLVDEIAKQADGIVHLAAIVGEAACKSDQDVTKSTNIDLF